jgi:hypothetical protein
MIIMEYEEKVSGRKLSWHNLSYHSATCMDGLRKTRTARLRWRTKPGKKGKAISVTGRGGA